MLMFLRKKGKIGLLSDFIPMFLRKREINWASFFLRGVRRILLRGRGGCSRLLAAPLYSMYCIHFKFVNMKCAVTIDTSTYCVQ